MSRWPRRDDTLPGELRSFGRRRGRGGSPRKSQLFETLFPDLQVDLSRPFAETVGATLNARPLWLEVGFGGGEHLLWQVDNAREKPLIIGCEPFEDGVGKVLAAIEDHGSGLENRRASAIKLHQDDARPLMRWLPDASVDRAFVLFPDPWPKKKHTKRRLVNSAFLAEMARVLKRGAELRVGTDIPDYARTILMAFQDEPRFRWQAATADDWRIRPDDWPATKYEQKAITEGRDRAYMRFKRV
jgi:tRNA (guanine-N7-)-methyltransferase